MSARLTSLINATERRLLTEKAIKVKPCWISEAIEYFSQNTTDQKEIYESVWEQFLLADISEACSTVLPETLLQKKEAQTFNGSFVLQMQYLLEISESPYDQWRRIHDKRLDEAEEHNETRTAPTKKKQRMLKLVMTDGYKEVTGMEASFISCLNTKLSPGIKLKITGPLQVVNKILLLAAKNVQVLGGEVDDLLIINAYENILLRALNKPITQTPKQDYVEETYSGDTTRSANVNIVAKPMVSSSNCKQSGANKRNNYESEIKMLEDIDFDDDDLDVDMLDEIEQIERIKNAAATVVNEAMDFDDDDIIALVDIDSIERAVNQQSPSATSTQISNPVNEFDIPVVSSPSVSSTTATTTSENGTKIINLVDVITDNEVIPRKIARVEPVQVPSPSDDNYPYKINGDNLVTIDQYKSLKLTERLKRNFIIWAKIASFNQPKLRNNGWEFRTNLEDNFSESRLPVKLTTACLDAISSATAAELCLMYTESKKRPQLRQDIEKCFCEVQQHLSELECFMKLESQLPTPSSDGADILVIELFETWKNSDYQILKRKAKEQNLPMVL